MEHRVGFGGSSLFVNGTAIESYQRLPRMQEEKKILVVQVQQTATSDQGALHGADALEVHLELLRRFFNRRDDARDGRIPRVVLGVRRRHL